MFASFIPPPPLSRARLVRRKAGVPFYVDDKHPEYGEFTISGTAPQVKKKSQPPKLAMHATHKHFPNFGEYFVDKEGREVFTNNGKPFYVGYHNGSPHKVFLAPNFAPTIRSRASAPTGFSSNGTQRLGGVGSD